MTDPARKWGCQKPGEQDIAKAGFSTPWDAPLVPPFPIVFRNAEILSLVYRSTQEAVRFLVPPPLEATGDTVVVHIYKMNDTDWIGSYGECNVMVGVRLPGTDIEGAFSPYLFLGSDGGLAQGREVHGQPKKSANVSLEARSDLHVGVLERNGIDVITATLAYKQTTGDIAELSAHMNFTTNINLKAVDHIDATPAIRQLTSRKLSNIVVHECWSGPCSVELRPNVQAPVFRLPVTEPLAGFYWRTDFTLVPGVVVHDYLKTE